MADKLLERMEPREPEPLPDDTTFSVKEAAEYLSVSEASVYRWAARGDFPSFRQGNRRMIHKRELDKWRAEGGGRHEEVT